MLIGSRPMAIKGDRLAVRVGRPYDAARGLSESDIIVGCATFRQVARVGSCFRVAGLLQLPMSLLPQTSLPSPGLS